MTAARRILFAAPLLACLASWALTSTSVETVGPAAFDPTVDVAGDALAMAPNNCTYYNNANHSQIVGQFGKDCCNNTVAWGRKSPYYVCGGCFICYPPPQ